MNEELLKTLAPLVEKTQEGIIGLVEVLERECPLLVEELLAWHFWSSLAECIVAAVIVAICVKVIVATRTRQWAKRMWDDGDAISVFAYMGLGLVGLVAAKIFADRLFNILQIAVAPRVWLLEYVGRLLRSQG